MDKNWYRETKLNFNYTKGTLDYSLKLLTRSTFS